jgi:uncharacterized membrane protein YoaK (UPF0700 family)
MADRDQEFVLPTLMALTLVGGVVDAVSYLGLGRVFTANMTGNVVVLGFAAAGAPGFSAAASLTSLAVFLVGAIAGGLISRRIASRDRLLTIAMIAEAVLASAAALVAYLANPVTGGWGRYAVISILALAMGMRNAVIRHLSVADMTTTVLTQTLTGLAADSSLAGGSNPRAGRRSAAVVSMLVGAVIGAAAFLHLGAWPPLLLASGVTAITALAFGLLRCGRNPEPR